MLHCSARRTSGNGGLPARYDAFLPLWHFDAMHRLTRLVQKRSYSLRFKSIARPSPMQSKPSYWLSARRQWTLP